MTAGRKAAVAGLEKRIGHVFADRDLLERALTHSSAAAEQGVGPAGTYERLEFLGDRVLGLAVADMLLASFPQAAEGDLHRRHAALVRKETCAAVARELDLGPVIRLGGGEIRSGGQAKETILGDVCEAIIGALYLDAGYESARRLVTRHWRSLMQDGGVAPRNAKAALQEWTQAQGLGTPTYMIVEQSGPAHAPRFAVETGLPGLAAGRGEGGSRREAEQAAAAAVLVREGVWTEAAEETNRP